MRVKVQKVGRGSHPSEVMVSVRTVEGEERLVVHKRSLHDDSTLEIGYPINEENSNYLVELPRETLKGEWRVWVPDTLVST